MGQQQLLLLVLGTIIVIVAIVIGITAFNSNAVLQNRDSIVADINYLSSDTYSYFIRARMMGGGNGSYTSYQIPSGLQSNGNGDYSKVIAGDGKSITLTGTSRNGNGTVTATVDESGTLSSFSFTGAFNQ